MSEEFKCIVCNRPAIDVFNILLQLDNNFYCPEHMAMQKLANITAEIEDNKNLDFQSMVSMLNEAFQNVIATQPEPSQIVLHPTHYNTIKRFERHLYLTKQLLSDMIIYNVWSAGYEARSNAPFSKRNKNKKWTKWCEEEANKVIEQEEKYQHQQQLQTQQTEQP